MPIVYTTISLIESAPVYGDAMSDQVLMYDIQKFVLDTKHPMVLRIRALRKLDECVGATGIATETDVINYCKEA